MVSAKLYKCEPSINNLILHIVKLKKRAARRNCSYQKAEDGLDGRTECADRLPRCTCIKKQPNFLLAVDHNL